MGLPPLIKPKLELKMQFFFKIKVMSKLSKILIKTLLKAWKFLHLRLLMDRKKKRRRINRILKKLPRSALSTQLEFLLAIAVITMMQS